MRRDRVAAVDPFAAQQPKSDEKPTATSTTNTTAPPNTAASSTSTNNNNNNNNNTTAQPPSGFSSSSTQQYYSSRAPPSSSSSSLLFDPFFKAASKSHATANRNLNNNGNNRNNQNNTNTQTTVTSSTHQINKNRQQDDASASSNIADTIQNLFNQSESAHVTQKKEEADEKWRQENEGKLLSPQEIVKSWKTECEESESVLSFTGQRKATTGITIITSKNTTSNVKSELAEDVPPPSSSADETTTTTTTDGAIPSTTNSNNFSTPFSLETIPEVEWWDRPFLAAPSYALGPVKQLPALGGAGAVNGNDPSVTSLAMKKATAAVYRGNSSSTGSTNNNNNSSNDQEPTKVCALPRKVGWNPQESEEKNVNRIENANETAQGMKTDEELRKERHARRVAAAKERQEQQRAQKADQHNFGLQRSIPVGPSQDGSKNSTNDPTNASSQPVDKVKVKHLNSALIKDVLLNPEVAEQARQAVHDRMKKHLEDNQRRHIDAKDRQQDHEFEVDKRHATESPRMIVVRCLGITDKYSVDRFKIICKQDLLLRGVFLWIRKRFLVCVLVGGENAIRTAEHTFLERFLGNTNILREGSRVDVVWGCTISDYAFSRSFLVGYSPFERDGRCKKPEKFIKREIEMKQAGMSGGVNNNNMNNTEKTPEEVEREYRRKYESIGIIEVPNMLEAKVWFSRNNLEYLWDTVLRSPVDDE